MPSDARSLLKAAAQERRKTAAPGISDPFASYNPISGALRCSACNYVAIKHESLWAAHIVSKSHRANALRLRQEQTVNEREEEVPRQAQAQKTKDGKRKAVDDDDPTTVGDAETLAEDITAKKARNAEGPELDSEWELFKRQMEAGEVSTAVDDDQYSKQATIEVQAQLHFDGDAPSAEAGSEDTQEETAAREKVRQEQEEREEILSRYEEEQRLQDEADERYVSFSFLISKFLPFVAVFILGSVLLSNAWNASVRPASRSLQCHSP